MFGRILLAGAPLFLTTCAEAAATSTPDAITPPEAPADQQAFLDACEPWDEWDKPAPPFKVHTNTYYVGTCGIAAILITSDDGHILIDTGTEEGADLILANIAALGFAAADIGWILTSHEHHDHMGGHAKVQRATGAFVALTGKTSSQILDGVPNPKDPQFSSHPKTEPVPAEAIALLVTADGGDSSTFTFTVGENELLMHRTPGHTPGALSWQWKSCEDEQCYTIVYADSLSPVSADDYKFSDHPEYLAEYRAGIERLHGLDCDILLTPHPSHSKMLERMKTGTLEGGMSCAEYADSKTAALDTRLAKERGE